MHSAPPALGSYGVSKPLIEEKNVSIKKPTNWMFVVAGFVIFALLPFPSTAYCQDSATDSPVDDCLYNEKGERYIHLNFVVDEMALVADVVFSRDARSNSQTIRDFKAQVRSICAEEYSSITSLEGRCGGIAAIVCRDEEPYRSCFEKILSEAKNTPQYSIILSQALDRLNECEKQWQKNYHASLDFMSELTSLPFHRSFTVFVSHPEVSSGCYLGNRVICWGGAERERNYTTVYLWHEILHSYLTEKTLLSHALIEMSADVELMRRLNGQGAQLWPGHNELKPMRKLIEADWNEFTRLQNETVLDFYWRLCKKLPSEDL
jgi:hypothetical protein